jgi:glycosyltransferase involved in cell wall biosynthesis
MFKPDHFAFSSTPASDDRPRFHYELADCTSPPYVTIITPFYNTGAVFWETARSVQRQSLQQWEWLIINDGSSEPEALKIIEICRQMDPRIRVIDHPTNLGLSAARNTGFKMARSSIVVQLDSDDLLEPTAIEKWCWFLESYPECVFVKGYTVGFGASEYLWKKGFKDGSAFLKANLVNPTSAVRRIIHQQVGGYDESDRGGLMDWDFWLRCASYGHWGATIPEYLDWYRRRPTHNDLWPDFDEGKRQSAYRARLYQKYPKLWQQGFPEIDIAHPSPGEPLPEEMPVENRLCKRKKRLLLIIPWMCVGGADKFNLDLISQLRKRDWEVSIVTTLNGEDSWLPLYAGYTPDIFILEHFLRPQDYPRFLRYLLQSRQTDIVMISHSEFGYQLLPYLRAYCPEVTFVDYCHIEEKQWKNGGYPRMSLEHKEMLDLTIVSSEHLQGWMVGQGGDNQRLEVCHTGVDHEDWLASAEQRATVRNELKVTGSTPVILYAARICAQKKPRVFAETMLKLRQTDMPFVAVVAGDGAEFQWLQSFVHTHKLSQQVFLLGEVSIDRIKQLMTAADVLFLPSQWEGIALTIYEAMSCALPIVSADVGGQRELVTEECGFLIRPGNEQEEIQQYTEIILKLLSDSSLRQQMGQAGRTRITLHFTLNQMGARVATLIQEAIKLHATEPRPQPALHFARDCARQAVDSLSQARVTAQLWAGRSDGGWRQRTYLTLLRLFDPYYQWALSRGWVWLFPVAERIKRILLRAN